jgi:ubiquinone/menaquinone biosynthesis C-methylase UbiE
MKILDAGYGCGIMLPDLYRRLSDDGKLYGIDIHGEHDGVVQKMFTGENMNPEKVVLQDSSLTDLPFDDDSFDLVVSVSVLEHIKPELLEACLREIKRVAKKDADIILGFPTDCLFIRILAAIQKQDLKENHPSTHKDIFSSIRKAGLNIVDRTGFPVFWGPFTMHYNVRVEY